jgi:soluble lytic murein transglycosylase-like protein
MSISIDNLSLLGSLASLRQKSDSNIKQQESGFAEKLDKVLGSGEASTASASSKAKELAESLTLQMLQGSLTLMVDSPSYSPSSAGSSPFLTPGALLQAYRDNLSSNSELPSLPQVSKQSQLQELADEVPAAIPVAQASPPHTDLGWLDPVIAKASKKYGVDFSLIKAVIKAESNFNPQAISHAGARGLMQLMPATARSLGVNDSFDPEQNVMGGTRFLKDMLQRYNGDVDAALAAYNWGPGNVDKRSEHLPRETRDYLTRVKQLYASYSG